MKRAFVMIAYNDRPRYLRLSIESLSRCEGLSDWDVKVFVDGPVVDKSAFEFLDNLSFPVLTTFRTEKLGNFLNMIYSMKESFIRGAYDCMLVSEEDFLLRPDILKVASEYLLPGLCCLRASGYSKVKYSGPPILVGKGLFEHLYQWIMGQQYVGLWDAQREISIPANTELHDQVLGKYVHEHKIVAAIEPISYGLHFGLRGMNYRQFSKDPEAKRLEEKIFNGLPSTWIGNLMNVFHRELLGSHFIHKKIQPKDFVYPGFEIPEPEPEEEPEDLKRTVLIGRWQPFHAGHKALIDSVKKEGRTPIIGVRDTAVDDKNPYTVAERAEWIRREYGDEVVVFTIPDFEEIAVGRKVGYKVIHLSEDVEKISGTDIRKELKEQGKL